MSKNEINGTVELSIGGGVFPAQAKVAISVARRFGTRSAEVLQPSVDALGEDGLSARLQASEEIDVLVARAVLAGGATSHAGKRRLLAKVVQKAVLDDAEIDQSLLIIEMIEQIDSPHIRCLEDIRRAELRAQASGEMGVTARGAEKPITDEVSATVRKYPEMLIRRLEGLGLVDGSLTWDGITVITGTTSTGTLILQELHNVDL
ncbi:hypothetical protein ACFQ9D_09695 [Arthrobacter koreensis]|uniref:hypothetical protein n=1 Tax=Arthrobacter koreensis TaxID=199136 RepID=UPI00363D7E0B